MKTISTIILLLLISIVSFGQKAGLPSYSPEYLAEIQAYQEKLNAEYSNPEESPLEEEDLEHFNGLPFFPILEKYRIVARFVLTPGGQAFNIPTSTKRKAVYEKYGEAHFELDGKKIILPVYQSHQLREKPAYADYLFLPFKDLTNGKESYGGGRYVDLRIPEGDSIIIDFNKAYNPYCAYSSRYSCPIPPKENRIKLAIPAGVKAPPLHE